MSRSAWTSFFYARDGDCRGGRRRAAVSCSAGDHVNASPEQLAAFGESVRRAARRADVRDAVRALYADLAVEIARRRPRCDASGRCCRFEEFGHRLFITTLELATFQAERQADHGPRATPDVPAGLPRPYPLPVLVGSGASTWDGTGCPYQQGGLCSVHPIRPFGCRIFFCDPTAGTWQQETYERFHAGLKREHERLNVPYFYVEWRQALRALNP